MKECSPVKTASASDDEPGIQDVGPVVPQGFSGFKIEQLGAGHFSDGLPGGRVPLTGGSETGVHVRFALGHQTDFQRTAGGDEFDITMLPPFFLDKLLEFRIGMGAASHDDEGRRWDRSTGS